MSERERVCERAVCVTRVNVLLVVRVQLNCHTATGTDPV